jgi:predicted GNAT family acetyltransferase
MTAPSDLTIDHDEDARRFHLLREGEAVGFLAYRPVGDLGDVVDVYTTQISPAVRGQGLGEILARAALDDLRDRGTSVRASCWFVADLLAADPGLGGGDPEGRP